MTTILILYAPDDELLRAQIERALRTNDPGRAITGFNAAITAGDRETDAILLARAASADCVVLIWSPAMARAARSAVCVHAAIQAWSRDRFALGRLAVEPLPPGLRDLHADPPKRATGFESVSVASWDADVDYLVNLVENRLSTAEPVVMMPSSVSSNGAGRTTVASGRISSTMRDVPGTVQSEHIRVSKAFGILAWLVVLAVLAALGVVSWLLLGGIPAFDPRVAWGALLVVFVGCGFTWFLAHRRNAKAPVTVLARQRTATSTASAVPPMVDAAAPGAAPQVFVSYSRRDADRVSAIVRHIEDAGYRVWIDTQSTEAAQRYAGQIVRAIRSVDVVALMCSRHAFESDHVVREIYVAGDFKKAFVAVQLDDAEVPDELHYFLSGYPRLPLSQIKPDRIRQELARYVVA
jgi:plasmid stabilization system protein ParE/DNA-binding transcriptional regulator YdaS (Cro superfamily)